MAIHVLHLLFCKFLDISILDLENGDQVGPPSLRRSIMCMIFRRNAMAFRPIGIGFGNVRSFVRHETSSSNISKPFDLVSPNFMGTSIPAFATATPNMTSFSTSGRQQIVQTCTFWVIIRVPNFSILVQPILKRFTVLETVIQGLHFFLCNILDIFAP